MNLNGRLMLGSVFVTDIGNGMFNLAAAILLYQETKSILAFALVLSGEFIIGLFMQLFAGAYVDRTDPKRTMVVIDVIRGSSLALAALLYAATHALAPLYVALIIINVVKPFYKSANFSLTGELVPEDTLMRLIGLKGSSAQAGQLLGMALAGPVIAAFGAVTALFIDGVTFYLSGLLIALIAGVTPPGRSAAPAGSALKTFVDDWREIAQLLWRQPSALLLNVLSIGDILFVALINLFLLPINLQLHNNPVHLAMMDGAFAVGSLTIGFVADRLVHRWGDRATLLGALSAQLACFALLAVNRDLPVLMAAMAVLGVANTLSITIFGTALQVRSKGPIKGRISAFRNLLTAVIVTVTLPLLAGLTDQSGVRPAILLTTGIIAVFVLGAALATHRHVHRFFKDPIYRPAAS